VVSGSGGSVTVSVSGSASARSPAASGGPKGKVFLYDTLEGTWRRASPARNGSVTLDAARYVSASGEVYVRLEMDFAQSFGPQGLTLEGVTA
jgi:hypothetical protein